MLHEAVVVEVPVQVYASQRVLLQPQRALWQLGFSSWSRGLLLWRVLRRTLPHFMRHSSMRPAPPSDPIGRTETSTSCVVDTVTPSSAVMRMAKSYDVLVDGAVLDPMGFWMDYLTETAAYRPGWQFDDGRMSELLVRFMSRARPLGSSFEVLASVASFSGVLTWPDDLLEGNMSTDDTRVHKDVEEIMSFAMAVSSSSDVPLWSSCHTLQHEADRLVKKA
ncbi:hypothetical protein AXG93_3352s1070 [Marchantia polymorpha subsp. ruderalis]|uniref:Uncharacterized protein n=1 Tax=Marchantia polymorpha subsp. ruderalis TaxID=1480154 RepID=A0A176VCT7_MARPO|nr:hypothetical protein AXG93_3352s1070 [Marchantia polymorpha subsp. ruderalis]